MPLALVRLIRILAVTLLFSFAVSGLPAEAAEARSCAELDNGTDRPAALDSGVEAAVVGEPPADAEAHPGPAHREAWGDRLSTAERRARAVAMTVFSLSTVVGAGLLVVFLVKRLL